MQTYLARDLQQACVLYLTGGSNVERRREKETDLAGATAGCLFARGL